MPISTAVHRSLQVKKRMFIANPKSIERNDEYSDEEEEDLGDITKPEIVDNDESSALRKELGELRMQLEQSRQAEMKSKKMNKLFKQ
eukprot:UN04773